MCAYFLHNILLSSFAKLIQTVMFNRYHDYRPKTYFTNNTSQITMPWNRPCCSYQLEIFRQYAQICLTRALLGLWIFHDLLGGGVFEHPPVYLGSCAS